MNLLRCFISPDECGLDFSRRPPSPPPLSLSLSHPRSSLRLLLLLIFLLFIPFSSFEIMQIQHPRFLVPLGRKANFCANQAGQGSKINVRTPRRKKPIDVLPPEMCPSASFDSVSRKQTRLLINCCLVFTRRKDFFFPFSFPSRPGKIDFPSIYRV